MIQSSQAPATLIPTAPQAAPRATSAPVTASGTSPKVDLERFNADAFGMTLTFPRGWRTVEQSAMAKEAMAGALDGVNCKTNGKWAETDSYLAAFYPPNASHAFEGPFISIGPMCARDMESSKSSRVIQDALEDAVRQFFGPDSIARLTNRSQVAVSGAEAYSAELNLYALGGQYSSLPNAGMRWITFMHQGRPWVVNLNWRNSAAERDAVEAAFTGFRLR
jgi:hypothetical protein